MSEVSEFRRDVSAWIEENCPAGAKGPGQMANGSTKIELEPDVAYGSSVAPKKDLPHPHGQQNSAAVVYLPIWQKFSMKKWARQTPERRSPAWA